MNCAYSGECNFAVALMFSHEGTPQTRRISQHLKFQVILEYVSW